MALKSYRERVEKLARERSGTPIYNGSLEHAAIIVENMFANARQHVCILTGKLNARVYGPTEVLEQAKLFLADSSHSAKILLENSESLDWTEHPFLDEFSDNENVEFRVVPAEVQQNYDFHFMVMDGDSYRFENDRTKHAAVAAFGDPDGAQNMENIFHVLWDVGEPIKAPIE